MGFVSDLFGGGDAADAAQQAGAIQAAAGERAREDLAPFVEAGSGQLGNINNDLNDIRNLVTDPNAQKDFVTNNPFFNALAEDSQRRIFNNKAARGKVGSGGTAEALQNSILLLGNDLVNQNVNQRQNIVSQGLNISSLGANAATNSADLATQIGNAQAGGVVGAANAESNALGSAIDTGLGIGGLLLSDRREKEFITPVGKVDGIPIYFFKYRGESELQLGTMAQEVEHIPGAVINIGGRKYVDYSRLH